MFFFFSIWMNHIENALVHRKRAPVHLYKQAQERPCTESSGRMGGGELWARDVPLCLRAQVPNVEPTRPTVFRHVVFAPIQSQDVKAANERGLWRELRRAAQIHPAQVVTESIQGPSRRLQTL